MNKKVLIISGSPRKGGNSDLLCDRFMEGAKVRQKIYGAGVYQKGEVENTPVFQRAYMAGKMLG